MEDLAATGHWYAVVWMKENASGDHRVAVLTDSLIMVSRLEKNMMTSTWWDSIKNDKAPILFVYVPSHSDITYNEKVDKLAGEASVFVNLVHEPDDVINEMEARLNEQGNTVQQGGSVQRLIESGWSCGDCRKSVEKGWERSLGNQVEHGSTLRRVIKGVGPGHQPASLLPC
jgi:hypothetical protein